MSLATDDLAVFLLLQKLIFSRNLILFHTVGMDISKFDE